MLLMRACALMEVWYMSIGRMVIGLISSASGGYSARISSVISISISISVRMKTLEVAIRCWNYVAKHLLDLQNGEWHWAILEDGTVNKEDDKAGFWKCPYHNSRMCLELIEREY